MKPRTPQAGFSLIELIVVVVLLGVLASGAGMLISSPIEAYEAQVRRQQLVDQGEMALRQIARDVRRALPNSIRITPVGGGSALEMVNIVDGGRYRDDEGGIYIADSNFVLDFAAADQMFNLLGTLNNPAEFNPGNRLVIYNTSINIYAEAVDVDDQGIITNAATSISVNTLNPGVNQEDQITLNLPFRFTQQSPGQRVFFVDSSISYICDPAANQILRYAGYGFRASQPTTPADFGVASGKVVSELSGCSFNYSAGSAQRGGILTVEITISDSGESVNLLHQIHVMNLP
ncbi:MAG: prepilin-type N-terminal cleavage/methylation domain-containing protein [Gammaproteobacteria bacterium]|nr:prepilin-type N-terminal cleavage/methylation domain-containing protein [Gammaproteobacteria bacterium]